MRIGLLVFPVRKGTSPRCRSIDKVTEKAASSLITEFMEATGLHVPEDPMTGMLESEPHAMASNGEAHPPALNQTADWTMEPAAPEPSMDSVSGAGDHPNPPLPPPPPPPPEVGSFEKGVEQFQMANAPLYPNEQPPPPPPLPPQPPEQPPELKADPVAAQPLNQDVTNQDGTEASQAAEDGMELEDAPKDAAQEAAAQEAATQEAAAQEAVVQEAIVPTEPELPSEFEKLLKGCEDSPEDFNAWVYLLQYVEQENILEAVRKSFDIFLLRYPYCYGYWKKYADIEKKHGYIHVAEEVYRRGLQAIPLSVDLWLHYMTYIKENSDTNDPETEGRIRAAYEHAVLAAGTDFRSDRLWESFITWETEQGKLANVTAIYDRILGIPTQLYSQHLQKFKDHVQNNNPKHFLSEEEFVQLRLELSKANLASMVGEDGEAPAPQEDLPPGMEDFADPAKRVTEIENMRHKVIEARQEVFNHNEHEVSKRWAFEEGIKRPYFHVKALEKTQLNNWREYLDFEMENGTPERVVVLFERCLIACALYEEFWIKYAKYLECYSTDGVRHVYRKACTVHLPRKPAIHLLWAAFEEQQSNVEEACSILKNLEVVVPCLAMVRLRRVSLERRRGNLDEAEALLKEAVESSKTTTETSFYAVKLARQFVKVQKSLSKARKVLLDAIERDQTSPRLYLNLLELEYSGDVTQNQAEIMACFDRALKSHMDTESRLLFAQRKVEFLEDFGSDIHALVAAYEELQNLQKEVDASKSKAENGYDSSQEPDAKRLRMDDGSMGAAAGTDMQANSAYNYNNWYQQQYGAWSQNSWGQYNQYAQYNQYYPPPPT
ncbi:pre-mRNA-processing factor 39 isoform X2 [Phyllopteryx taeniolatus]|uniref:pre-mRNA-processing factor 39 isoform X2 n=1 Tax=Phyllopteryx taeniolatus TaxID=161469 RepID=UPI002AD2848C|nr:pre-mRNA-processing factor 39 isoform X2 [Phyllopteryx taeniolatus]